MFLLFFNLSGYYPNTKSIIFIRKKTWYSAFEYWWSGTYTLERTPRFLVMWYTRRSRIVTYYGKNYTYILILSWILWFYIFISIWYDMIFNYLFVSYSCILKLFLCLKKRKPYFYIFELIYLVVYKTFNHFMLNFVNFFYQFSLIFIYIHFFFLCVLWFFSENKFLFM